MDKLINSDLGMTVIIDKTSDISLENKYVFENVLPFPFLHDIESVDLTIDQLLQDNFKPCKHSSSDGFIDFHHLKFVTSNAKQMSVLFQLTMGFEEIAYRGLENGSQIIASHVVRNNKIIIEFMNTLTNEDSYPLDSFDNKCDEIVKLEDDLIAINTEVFQLFNRIIRSTMDENQILSDDKIQYITTKIENSNEFKRIKNVVQKAFEDVYQYSTCTIHDLMDAYLLPNFLKYHGEGVMDVSFQVNDVDGIFLKAKSAGAVVIKRPKILRDDFGSVKVATIGIPNTDIHHTIVEVVDYKGNFLPGYIESETQELSRKSGISIYKIDHCVENYTWNQMQSQATMYAKMFGFHKFWSVDDADIATENTALNSLVMTSTNGKIKMPINEPSPKSKMKSQIEEFYDFNGGPGVQHVAFRTHNIIETVKQMIKNGVQFNKMKSTYYENLRKRFIADDIVINQKIDELESLCILIDYDVSSRNPKTKTCNYLLQIFTKPLSDRPTIFIELIERHHHSGFGKGTFKGLFESIEDEQRKRGTLIPRYGSK